ncbi:MAG: MdtA/MuxA family multidrug efflux RND transporter periplasmic adaptor subunit [Planctomycetota bacterium]
MRAGVVVVVCLVVGGGALLLTPRVRALVEASKSDGKSDGSANGSAAVTSRAGARATPVSVATAKKGDLRVYFSAPGTVAAFNTVTVRSRVDGELVGIHFVEGQIVKETDLLFEIDPRPFKVQLANAEGQLARDQALVKNASLQLERFKEAKDAISQQQIDTMTATVNQLEGTLKSDEAAVEAAKLQLVYSRISAPITGRIGLRGADKGNMIRSNANDLAALAVITQIRPIAVFFSLPQDDLAAIATRVEAGAKLPVEAHDRDLRRKLATGELLTYDNQIDVTTGTVRFKAVFKNDDGKLFPNQFVNVRLLVDTKKNAVLVPTAAVQRSPRSTFVYVVKTDETVELRDITIGGAEADETAVEKGLAEGEVVVTEGIDKIQNGAKVSVPQKREKVSKAP